MPIRDETPGDEAAIRRLVTAAFAPVEMSDGREAAIVDALRRRGELAVSLVAAAGGEVIGHIAFSPVTLSGAGGRWFGLGPIAVRPDRQNSGLGRQLVETGLERLRSLGAAGCVLVGDPGYYGRFGFRSGRGLAYGDVPAEYVQSLALGSTRARGEIRYSPAFEDKARG